MKGVFGLGVSLRSVIYTVEVVVVVHTYSQKGCMTAE